MSKHIPVSLAKSVRESIGASHLVMFAIIPGEGQVVATHGDTAVQGREAAAAGNKLKGALGWPPEACNAAPIARTCGNCSYFTADRGTWCANGWSGGGSNGYCHLEPRPVSVQKDGRCRYFEPNA
jgi:hypothetical protein